MTDSDSIDAGRVTGERFVAGIAEAFGLDGSRFTDPTGHPAFKSASTNGATQPEAGH